jgi:hypothetical protein
MSSLHPDRRERICDRLVAKANIGGAKAQQQLQSTILDFYTLAAPYDAMVTTRLRELGSALGAGEPVFQLGRTEGGSQKLTHA